ncbi:MAG: DUF2236 domain-containing protein [Actinomycetia bacterium]|nr:DUF2236 domain-containing protein [Actinomycetes bacterium]
MIGEVVSSLRNQGGTRVRAALVGDERMATADLATHDDPGLFGPGSVAWRVHAESSMLIGGLRALLLQTLHPLALAGVADHSVYRQDPWGRLHRTARFIGATTYGNTATAEQIIARIRAIHAQVTGVAPDGTPYEANDPHLLLWVHITEIDSFLRAYDRYAPGRLTDDERDRYVAEMAGIGRRLGAENVPTSWVELAECLESFRSECEPGPQARESVRFLLMPPVPFLLRGPYGLIGAASVGLLPAWARHQLRLPLPPGLDPLAIRPATALLTRSIGWLLNEETVNRHDDKLLTA